MANKDEMNELEYLQNHEMSRRDFLMDMLAAGGMAAAGMMMPSMLQAAAQSADDEVVRIGYRPITDATSLLVAHGMGFFEEEGLKAEKPTLIRGWSPLVESFAAGKVNLVHFLKPIPVWMRYNNNFPVKIMSWAHINGSAVVAESTFPAMIAGSVGRGAAESAGRGPATPASSPRAVPAQASHPARGAAQNDHLVSIVREITG